MTVRGPPAGCGGDLSVTPVPAGVTWRAGAEAASGSLRVPGVAAAVDGGAVGLAPDGVGDPGGADGDPEVVAVGAALVPNVASVWAPQEALADVEHRNAPMTAGPFRCCPLSWEPVSPFSLRYTAPSGLMAPPSGYHHRSSPPLICCGGKNVPAFPNWWEATT